MRADWMMLPEDVQVKIWKMYFVEHVLQDLQYPIADDVYDAFNSMRGLIMTYEPFTQFQYEMGDIRYWEMPAACNQGGKWYHIGILKDQDMLDGSVFVHGRSGILMEWHRYSGQGPVVIYDARLQDLLPYVQCARTCKKYPSYCSCDDCINSRCTDYRSIIKKREFKIFDDHNFSYPVSAITTFLKRILGHDWCETRSMKHIQDRALSNDFTSWEPKFEMRLRRETELKRYIASGGIL